MTTQVTIRKTDAINHHDILVSVLDAGVVVSSNRLTDRGRVQENLWDGQTLSISEIEKEISEDLVATEAPAAGTGPRITPQDLEDQVLTEEYHVFPGTMLTVCCITMLNGFTVTGESACAAPENFNQEMGENIARDNAIRKIWPLLGYELKQALHVGGIHNVDA